MTTSALPVNADAGDQPPTPASGTDRQWCPGRLDANAVTQPTNTLWLKAGQIYPFVNNVRVYHCPADSSTYVTTDQAMCAVNGPGDPRVRSISMNGFVNASPDDFFSGGFTVYRKTNALAHPGAAVLWLFLDENPTASTTHISSIIQATPEILQPAPLGLTVRAVTTMARLAWGSATDTP